MIDRLPPQSSEAEQSILGSILIDRDAIIEVADFLKPEDFYRQAHGRIYAAMIDLSERRIRFYKVGKYVRFDPNDVADFIRQGRVDAVRPALVYDKGAARYA